MEQSKRDDLPWIEKYRPTFLTDIYGHKTKIMLANKIVKGKIENIPHLLLHGPPGSGKTSFILAFVRELYGTDYRQYIKELNASDERGIKTVREDIKSFVIRCTNKPKFVILDEADAMTNDAQGALRRIMEIHVESARFCLICNDISKIIEGIRSRCTEIPFNALPPLILKLRLADIVVKEGIKIEDSTIDYLSHMNIDLRQLLNIIQCLYMIYDDKIITQDDINEYLGIPSNDIIMRMIRSLFSKDIKTNIKMFNVYILSNKFSMPMLLERLTDKIITLFNHDKLPKIDEKKLMKILNSITNASVYVTTGCNMKPAIYNIIATIRHQILK